MTPSGRRPSARTLNSLTRELATWLEDPDLEAVAGRTARWSPGRWIDFRTAVTMHGLAPHFARSLTRTSLAEIVPPAERDWLVEQDRLNTLRLRRMHDQLSLILAAAAKADIEVMPLKGALLTTMGAFGGHGRPMADLDLLVRPADRRPMRAVLERLGYTAEPERSPRPTHDVYVDPEGARIVAAGEHPENPRRVELHDEVMRHLWGWTDDDQLTEMLWRGAERAELVGQPATLPRLEGLLAHLAIHASSDLLMARGRLVQWLDLALVAPKAAVAGVPHAVVAYPSLRLAARALPRAMAGVDLSPLERAVPQALVRWAAAVPLDARCGLTVGRPPDRPASLGARWERWRPLRWRMAVAYGDVSVPRGLWRHAATIRRRATERLSRRPGE